jgi:hypothetical protein
MNVRQLTERLAIADPEDLVVIDADSQSLFLVNPRSGMFQPLDVLGDETALTERDKEFLCSLRVRF